MSRSFRVRWGKLWRFSIVKNQALDDLCFNY